MGRQHLARLTATQPRTAVVVAIAIAGSLVMACSTGTASQPAAEEPIEIRLTEWTITPDPATTSAVAPRVFSIRNEGSEVHEFVVIRTDLKADSLPTVGSVVDDTAVTIVGEVENIVAGTTETVDVDLPAGHYALICNLEGHYMLGMHADFEVS